MVYRIPEMYADLPIYTVDVENGKKPLYKNKNKFHNLVPGEGCRSLKSKYVHLKTVHITNIIEQQKSI